MAHVWLAHDLRHDRPVALKVLRPELAAVIGAERFLAEIKLTANLQHPHILPLFDSGEADGFLFYVMPFVEGESLRDRLETEVRAITPEVVVIAENEPRLPNTTSLALPGASAETLVIQLDLAGIAVSAGAACSSGKVRASRVLTAMGVAPAVAGTAIRVSLGWSTTEADVDRFIETWTGLWSRLGIRDAGAARAAAPAA